MSELFTPLFLARNQMAFTLGFHIIFACFGVGLPILMVLAEWRYLRTKDAVWLIIAKRWAKAFGVLFAVGAVSGTVLSFELGLLWPNFMGTYGSVISLPFTLEGFAFFIEAIFIGIYLYAWNRLPEKIHILTGLPVVIAGVSSAWFVVTANAWMNSPQGFELVNGMATHIDPLAAMFNRSTAHQTLHMILAAFMVSSFGMASLYAILWLRGHRSTYIKYAMMLPLIFGAVVTPFQIFVGDWAGKVVAKYQPIKFAAMEGQFKTESHAPLRIGGIPDRESRSTKYAIEIPGLLSWIAFGDSNAEVKGLDDFEKELHPPLEIVHLAFQVMVGMGVFLLLISIWALIHIFRSRDLPKSLLFYWLAAFSGLAAILALESGWVVTEVGRQPWIVVGFMKTAEAVTNAPGIGWIFLATLLIYTTLTIGMIIILRHLANRPIMEDSRGL